MFWIGAILLTAVACAFVLLPLLLVRKDDQLLDDRDQLNVALFTERTESLEDEALESEAKKDLLADTAGEISDRERASTGDRRLVVTAAVLLPFLAFLVYGDLGLGWGAISDVKITETLATLDAADPDSYEQFAGQVEQRLDVNPDDQDMQYLLASIYSGLGRFEESATLYAGMLNDFPDDANLLSQYAEVLFVADGRRLTPRVIEASDRALRVDPINITVLEIRGIGAMGEGRPEEALQWFNKALATGVTGRRAELLQIAIARIENANGVTSESRVVLVDLSVDESVEVPDSSTIFVYARAVEGPAAPLAVRRLQVKDLPGTVRLDETMAMVPGMSLANFETVTVVARISQSGEVVPSPGDIEARSGPVTVSDEPLTVLLTLKDAL